MLFLLLRRVVGFGLSSAAPIKKSESNDEEGNLFEHGCRRERKRFETLAQTFSHRYVPCTICFDPSYLRAFFFKGFLMYVPSNW